jgi:RNA polymerase sigma-70 factor, ECF subfamily
MGKRDDRHVQRPAGDHLIAEASLTGVDPFGRAGTAANDTDQAPALDFRTIFERYSHYVATIAFRLLGRNDEVDDVVQDVFLQVHRRLSTIRPDAVRGWLAVVTVRATRRRLRRRWLWRTLGMENITEELPDPDASPEQRAHVLSVGRLLDKMPADNRIAWLLKQVEGKTIEETANLCGCSVSTAQRRLRAAHIFLNRARAQ